MFLLLVMLAIVVVWLMIMSRQKVAPINTALFHTNQETAAAPAPAPETVTEEVTQPETTEPAPEETTAAPEAAPAPETQPETQAPAAAGTAVDTGVFRTMCPDGWMYFEQRDMFGQMDENGNYPPDPTQMCFCKGAQTELDIFSKLSVYAYFQNEGFSQQVVDNNIIWYSETEPFTVMVNGTECQGFHARSEDIFNEGQFYEYDYVFLPVDADHHIQVRILTYLPGLEETLSRDDPDVQLILNNLAADAA